MAASEGHLEAVQYLVNHGANILHRDCRQNSAFDDAVREGRTEVAEYLDSKIRELEAKRQKEISPDHK